MRKRVGSTPTSSNVYIGDVAKMVDALDLGSSTFRGVSSTPTPLPSSQFGDQYDDCTVGNANSDYRG